MITDHINPSSSKPHNHKLYVLRRHELIAWDSQVTPPSLVVFHAGTIDYKEMEATYRISRRIEGEERALDAVSCVFTSTGQEVQEQWGTYDGCVLERVQMWLSVF